MIDLSQFTTTFTTYDKQVHFLLFGGLFCVLAWVPYLKAHLWLTALTVFALGVLYELYQLLTGEWFDWYDLTANTAGILLAWVWVWHWTR